MKKNVDIWRATEKATIYSQSMGTEDAPVMKVYKTNKAKEPARKKNAYSVVTYMHQNATDVQPMVNCAMHARRRTILSRSAPTRTDELLNRGAASQREASAMLHDHACFTLTHHQRIMKMNTPTGWIQWNPGRSSSTSRKLSSRSTREQPSTHYLQSSLMK